MEFNICRLFEEKRRNDVKLNKVDDILLSYILDKPPDFEIKSIDDVAAAIILDVFTKLCENSYQPKEGMSRLDNAIQYGIQILTSPEFDLQSQIRKFSKISEKKDTLRKIRLSEKIAAAEYEAIFFGKLNNKGQVGNPSENSTILPIYGSWEAIDTLENILTARALYEKNENTDPLVDRLLDPKIVTNATETAKPKKKVPTTKKKKSPEYDKILDDCWKLLERTESRLQQPSGNDKQDKKIEHKKEQSSNPSENNLYQELLKQARSYDDLKLVLFAKLINLPDKYAAHILDSKSSLYEKVQNIAQVQMCLTDRTSIDNMITAYGNKLGQYEAKIASINAIDKESLNFLKKIEDEISHANFISTCLLENTTFAKEILTSSVKKQLAKFKAEKKYLEVKIDEKKKYMLNELSDQLSHIADTIKDTTWTISQKQLLESQYNKIVILQDLFRMAEDSHEQDCIQLIGVYDKQCALLQEVSNEKKMIEGKTQKLQANIKVISGFNADDKSIDKLIPYASQLLNAQHSIQEPISLEHESHPDIIPVHKLYLDQVLLMQALIPDSYYKTAAPINNSVFAVDKQKEIQLSTIRMNQDNLFAMQNTIDDCVRFYDAAGELDKANMKKKAMNIKQKVLDKLCHVQQMLTAQDELIAEKTKVTWTKDYFSIDELTEAEAAKWKAKRSAASNALKNCKTYENDADIMKYTDLRSLIQNVQQNASSFIKRMDEELYSRKLNIDRRTEYLVKKSNPPTILEYLFSGGKRGMERIKNELLACRRMIAYMTEINR